MGIFSLFFKQKKHKTFSFTPRYYDEVKERQKKLLEEIEKERNGTTKTTYNSQIKGAFRAENSKTSKVKRKSNVRLVVILAVLILLAYYWLYR
ncbi:MAG: hypothetical protein IPO21_09345 [Bacteroidales bacterium]|nr:hypothetical protein [Bacteroidales bacterium]